MLSDCDNNFIKKLKQLTIGLFFILLIHITYKLYISQIPNYSLSPPRIFSWNSSNFIWSKSEGATIVERVELYNLLIHDWKIRLNRTEPAPISPPSKTLDSKDYDIFEQLELIPQITVIALTWSNKNNNDPWLSFNDTSNILIQKYYKSTFDDVFCKAMFKGRSSEFFYELIYNQTVNCKLPEDKKYYRLEKRMFNHCMASTAYFTQKECSSPSHSLTYLLIFQNAIVSNNGNVYTSEVKYTATGCLRADDFPQNHASLAYYEQVFTISQYWGTGHFHRMLEVLPRLILYVNFLKKNPEIYIHCPNKNDSVVKFHLDLLGLNSSRMIDGWVRANVLYFPKPTPCGKVRPLEIQLLAREYSLHMAANASKVPRNKLVFIKRSYRNFVKETSLIKSLEKFCAEFNMTLTIFSDDPLPSHYETMVIFNSARMVVAPHGAGLSNIVYCRPGTFIFEGLYETWYANACYERLARLIGMQYYGAISTDSKARSVIKVRVEWVMRVLRHYATKQLA